MINPAQVIGPLQCLTCYRFKAQATHQLMGELPSARVQPSRPFLTSGVDYSGPISLKLGTPRSKIITKGYIAIFVCFATRAIHIEVVESLTTEAFLAALRRFIARSGKPRTIYSDNGTNFQGAAKQLHAIYDMSDPHQRWNKSRTSWPMKDAIGSSSHHMPHTSEDYGKQLLNP